MSLATRFEKLIGVQVAAGDIDQAIVSAMEGRG